MTLSDMLRATSKKITAISGESGQLPVIARYHKLSLKLALGLSKNQEN
ncbi:hypothetical protein HZY62_09030 [Maribacter polysiphoniae]|uniref:Uncharacterized protein n=1 Tax=Maribacter polysiphoniae TaxID=429344 RepID=A0ABR7VXP0_9FLAO|nr:hypothetical protein [Maribacter polysiphoniae]